MASEILKASYFEEDKGLEKRKFAKTFVVWSCNHKKQDKILAWKEFKELFNKMNGR